MVSRRVRRRRRQVATVGGLLVVLLIYLGVGSGGGKPSPPAHHHSTTTPETFPAHSPLNPSWRGDGKTVTLGFGGDVHFAGAVGQRLTQNPATALGNTPSQLFAGAQVRVVDLDTALTAGTCPQPQRKPFIFVAPPTALTALHDATVTLAVQANDHAVDCGLTGLAQGLTAAHAAAFPLVGVGDDATQAFTPYRTKVNGQRIAVIAATQTIAANLVATWTATSTQAGVASALNPAELVAAVQAARRTADTVVVYLNWGTSTVACPNPQQEPLADELVKAGADIVVGTGAHVLLGGGYLGDAFVDYGLGNFAFYDDSAPETDSGSLLITTIGRHIVSATFHPATDLNGLPQPLSGTPATTALQSLTAARRCTNLSAAPSSSQASERGETSPYVAPATASTTTTSGATTGSTTTTSTSHSSKTTTTTAAPTTTGPTDNAG